MRRLLIIGALLGALLVPTAVYADDETIVIDAPKGVIGYDGIRCIGEATQGGHHLKLTTYEGSDAGEMADRPASERAWQVDQCRSDLELMFGFWFGKRGVTFDPSTLKVTTERV